MTTSYHDGMTPSCVTPSCHDNKLVSSVSFSTIVLSSSTYLVAFVMSDLEETKVTTSRGVAVSVYSRPGKKNSSQTGLETVKNVSVPDQLFDLDSSSFQKSLVRDQEPISIGDINKLTLQNIKRAMLRLEET